MRKQMLVLFLVGAMTSTISYAQTKKHLTPEDYGKWQSLGAINLSPDGQWAAYGVTVQEDNDTVYVLNTASHKMHKLEFASFPEFSADNQWVAYRIGVSYKEAEKARETMRPIEYKMGLLNLATGKKEEVKNISRFSFSRNGKYLAVYLTPPKENKDKGAVLLVKNLTDGTTRTIGNVTEFAFNKKSDFLAYIVESANTAGNSIELYHLPTGNLKVLASDTSRFSKLTWQKEGEGLAFFKAYRKDRYEEDNAVVYAYTNVGKVPVMKIFDPEVSKDFPEGMRIFTGSSLALSDDGTTAFFGLKPWTYNELAKKTDRRAGDSLTKADTARIDSTRSVIAAKKGTSADKLAGLDIWHWQDPEIQPRQKVTLSQDTLMSTLTAWSLDNGRFFRLTTEEAPLAQL